MCLVLYNIRTRLNYRAHPYRHMCDPPNIPGFLECQASGFSGHLRKTPLHYASWCALLGATAATEGFYILTQFVLLGIFLHYHWFQHRTPEPSRQVAPLNLFNLFLFQDKDVARLQDFQELELVLMISENNFLFRNAASSLTERPCYNRRASKLTY